MVLGTGDRRIRKCGVSNPRYAGGRARKRDEKCVNPGTKGMGKDYRYLVPVSVLSKNVWKKRKALQKKLTGVTGQTKVWDLRG